VTDVLENGSDAPLRLSRRVVVVLVVVGLVVVAGFAYWRWRPVPPPIFSLSGLQGVYSGMVRSDGTNDASVIDVARTTGQPGTVTPAGCEPLFEATVLNRPPAAALDGVGTFWAAGATGVSLFTYRFPGEAGAAREYARLTTAAAGCRGTRVEVRSQPAVSGTLTGLRDDKAQLAYVLTSAEGTKLAVHVLLFSNSVSWQYRYEPTPGPYAPQTAQNVMDSLSDQMRAVQALAVSR
jgi:hypothetical protein